MTPKKRIFALLITLSAGSLWAGNLYTNSGFESNAAGWNLYKQDTSVAATLTLDTAGVMFGKKYCRITVTKVNADPVANNWYVQLQDPVWQARKHINYTFSCWARADSSENRSIHVAAQGDSASMYTYRSGSTIPLTTEWTKYEYPFLSDVDKAGQLNFFIYLGGAVGVYDFDSMALDSATDPGYLDGVLGSAPRIATQTSLFTVELLPDFMRIAVNGPQANANTVHLYSLEGRLVAKRSLPANARAFEMPKPGRGVWVVDVNSNRKVIRVP